jgi:uridine kinase
MSTDAPFIILVAGGTASGKTSIVEQFVETTGATHIGHDRYYFDAPEPRGHDFDHPDSLDTHLLVEHVARLRAGKHADLPVYVFASHSRAVETERVEPSPLMVIEGILILQEPRLVALADLVVFVEASETVRLERRIRRDITERGRTKESVMEQFHKTVKPNHDQFVQPSKARAGLVLDGTAAIEESVNKLVSALP